MGDGLGIFISSELTSCACFDVVLRKSVGDGLGIEIFISSILASGFQTRHLGFFIKHITIP